MKKIGEWWKTFKKKYFVDDDPSTEQNHLYSSTCRCQDCVASRNRVSAVK